MQYRKFGRLDWQASVLGFGWMYCGVCRSKCPDHLPISNLLADVDALLSPGKPYPQR